MKLKDVKVLRLGISSFCNGKCIICWHSNKQQFPLRELDDNIYHQLKQKLFKHLKVLHICGGGETFLYSKIDTLLQDASKYKFKITVTSNLAYLTESQKQLLIPLDIDFVVSLDGSSASLQNFLRPGCDYDTIIKNIKFLKSCNKKVTIQTTVNNYNFLDIENMLLLADSLGVDYIRFQEVQYISGLETPYKFSKPPKDIEYLQKVLNKTYKTPYRLRFDYYATKPRKEFSNLYTIKDYLLEYIGNRGYCPNTRREIRVQEDGIVSACCLPESKPIGNLNFNTLEEIIDTPEYDNMRKTCTCVMMSQHKK